MRVNADKDAQDDKGEIVLKSRTNVMIFKVTISIPFLLPFYVLYHPGFDLAGQTSVFKYS